MVHADRLVKHAGQFWIAHSHLEYLGYEGAGVGTIIRVGRETTKDDGWAFFEIDGPVMRLDGEPNSPLVKGWWLQRADRPAGWVPDTIPESDATTV
jgi:hypothetical protein